MNSSTLSESQTVTPASTTPFFRRRKFRVIGAAVIISLCIIGILYATWPHWIRGTDRVTVTDKQRNVQGAESIYMVFTKDEGGKVHVFKNVDSKMELKWNSSDIQGELETGKMYDIKSYGIRFTLTSSYPNITKVKEVAVR